MTTGLTECWLFVVQEEPPGPVGSSRQDACGDPRAGHQVLHAARRPTAADPDIRTTAPKDPTVPVGPDHVPGPAPVEGPGPAVLAAVAARRPLRQGREVVLGAGRHVLPRDQQPVQNAAPVALPHQSVVRRSPAVQQPAARRQDSPGRRRRPGRHPARPGVPVDQGRVSGGHRVRLRLRPRTGRLRVNGCPLTISPPRRRMKINF